MDRLTYQKSYNSLGDRKNSNEGRCDGHTLNFTNSYWSTIKAHARLTILNNPF